MARGETYGEFVEKFKPKLTTDDCYTPPLVYAAVRDWVVAEYGIDAAKIVRPFYPGGDYENFDYSDGAVVVDNPPFSLLSKVVKFYAEREIPFFLFAPHLTLVATAPHVRVCRVITMSNIIYENGAEVKTSFVTNLEPDSCIRTAPDLHRAVAAAVKETTGEKKKQPRLAYPPELVTAARLGRIVKSGDAFRISHDEALFVRHLDAQKAVKKSIYGGGFLISAAKAAELAERERVAALDKLAREQERERKASAAGLAFELSEREREIVDGLG